MSAIVAVGQSGERRAPLTVQQRFWLKHFGMDHKPMAFGVRIRGALRYDDLSRSLEHLSRRHDVLRTQISASTFEQIIFHEVRVAITVVQVLGNTEAERLDHAMDAARAFAGRERELRRELLFDATLVRLTQTDHIFVWSIHHIVADGSAVQILTDELWRGYCDRRQLPREAELQHGYSDYSLWQHGLMAKRGAVLNRYWSEKLATAECLRWPTLPLRGKDSTEARPLMPMTLDRHVCSSLQTLARKQGTSAAIIMLAIFALAALHRCNQREAIIPVSASGRVLPVHGSVVGYFGYFAFVRVRLVTNGRFVDFLRRVTQEFRETMEHQDFGAAATQAPHLLSGGLYSWLPAVWKLENLGGAPPNLVAQMNLEVEPLGLITPTTGGSGQRVLGAMLWYDDDGTVTGELATPTEDISVSDSDLESDVAALTRRVVDQPNIRIASASETLVGARR